MSEPLLFIEENLELELGKVLAIIQERTFVTSYMGITAIKNPFDFWVYQEIAYETRPEFIVEIGNHMGGTLLALAHLLERVGGTKVIGVDASHGPVHNKVKEHPTVLLIEGDATRSFGRVREAIPAGARVMVIEDSSHTYENTLAVLRAYSPLCQPGDYFIVEDGICGHGIVDGPRPSPYEATEAFIKENPGFVCDRSRESFFITWNPKGFLRRV
jgi:cephalosporin hydroxylase